MKTVRLCSLTLAGLMLSSITTTTFADAPKMKYSTDIPPNVVTPDKMETRLGTLEFVDGVPTEETAQKVWDQMDFSRAVEVMMMTTPAASLQGFRKGIQKWGPDNETMIYWNGRLDSKGLLLTGNTTVVYTFMWIDLKDGPMVMETPPNVLGIIDDAWFHYLTDFGDAGEDKGKGGKYLLVPPGYDGDIPDGYLVRQSETNGHWLAMRGFMKDFNPDPVVKNMKDHFRLYPLGSEPKEVNWVNTAMQDFSTLHAQDASFFDEVNITVQEEPNAAQDAEMLGLLAAIGIEKGKPFEPDARMQKILDEAAKVGTAAQRSIIWRNRDERVVMWPDSKSWEVGFAGGSYAFEHDGVSLIDDRVRFHFYATGITPAMVKPPVGAGSSYVIGLRDAEGQPLDGSKTYRIHIPPNIPAKRFWDITVYDNQTRSLLQTDTPYPGVTSIDKATVKNADGSYDVYIGPMKPDGDVNWIQTDPSKGWNMLWRIYGPLQAWYDKTWRPSEIELVGTVESAASGAGVAQPPTMKMTTPIPASITAPAAAQTSIGTLDYFDGVPSATTVETAYDYLDRSRAVNVFMNSIPMLSMDALREGQADAGCAKLNQICIWDGLMDSTTLLLTGNTSTMYAVGFLDLDQDGPTVIDLPTGMLGVLDDMAFRYMTDLGVAGPDKGKGGKYLVLPPDYQGEVPEGYFAVPSETNGVWVFMRGYLDKTLPLDQAIPAASANIRDKLKVYSLADQDNPPATEFIDVSGKEMNTILPNDASAFEKLHALIQGEPDDYLGPEAKGMMAAIGIEKGKPFEPDARMQQILTDAAAIGNAAARSISYFPRDPGNLIYGEDSAWMMAYANKDTGFETAGAYNLDARVLFHFGYIVVSPAMAVTVAGKGSDYALIALDANKQPLDGSKTYKLHLPPNVPAKDFWALTMYDTQTRSQLQTDQQFPTLGSQTEGIVTNADGSYDIYFAPSAPEGKAGNWLQTVPGKSWWLALRMYGPEEAWIKQTWRPGEIELVE